METANDLIIPKDIYDQLKHSHTKLEKWAIQEFDLDCSQCGSKKLALTFTAAQELSLKTNIIMSATCKVATCQHIMHSHNGLNPKNRVEVRYF